MTDENNDTQLEPKKLGTNDAQKQNSNVPQKLETDASGSIQLMNLQSQLTFANRLISEKMISTTFKNAQQVVLGMQYAMALKMDPVIALSMMYVVNGRPCLYGDGPKVLVSRTGMIESFREYYIDENGDEIVKPKKGQGYFGAVCEIKRKNESGLQRDWFTLDDLERAGIDYTSFGKKKDVWAQYERIMMRYKARSMALKAKFADALAGIPIAENDFNTIVKDGGSAHIEHDVTPPKSSNDVLDL